MDNPRHVVRGSPELIYVYSNLGALHSQIADLQKELGDKAGAAASYAMAVEKAGDDQELAGRAVMSVLEVGEKDRACDLARGLVERNHANRMSVQLLRQVLIGAGRVDQLAPRLQEILAQRPRDRELIGALADALESAGRRQEAERVLRDALARPSLEDAALVQRLVELYRDYQARLLAVNADDFGFTRDVNEVADGLSQDIDTALNYVNGLSGRVTLPIVSSLARRNREALAAIARAHDAGSLTRTQVREALGATDFNGLTGPVTFDASGFRRDAPLYLYRWKEEEIPLLVEQLR